MNIIHTFSFTLVSCCPFVYESYNYVCSCHLNFAHAVDTVSGAPSPCFVREMWSPDGSTLDDFLIALQVTMPFCGSVCSLATIKFP